MSSARERSRLGMDEFNLNKEPFVILYAPNVGFGGGLVLVREILAANWCRTKVFAFVDERAKREFKDVSPNITLVWCKSSFSGRLIAEYRLARLSVSGCLILCLHNLPPIFPTNGNVICFVQNAHVVGLIDESKLGLKLRLRCAAERVIARIGKAKISEYIVQTPTMREALISWLGNVSPPVSVMPFLGARPNVLNVSARHGGRYWDFLYVSDGARHKNHRRLLQAWALLADDGLFPTLALTLHPARDRLLRKEVETTSRRHSLQISDLGQLPHQDLLQLYNRAGALLFPSLSESFGIPLLEATDAGLPIIAGELDYVRDVCVPIQTFDARSPKSIARAVKRFLGVNTESLDLLSAQVFVQSIIARSDDNSSRSLID